MSRFIQNYRQHLADAERTDGVLRLAQRAGRPAWLLESESRVRATEAAVEFLSAALSVVVHDEKLLERFAASLASSSALPWVAFLPDRDREEFMTEAAETLRACASVGKFTAFADLVEEWRATAEVWSDPALAAALTRDISEPLDVSVDSVAP